MQTNRIVGAVALGALAGALVLTGTATATAQEPPLSISVEADDCTATITYRNSSESAFWGDWRTADDAGFEDSTVDGPNLTTDSVDPAEFGDVHNHGVEPDTPLSEDPYVGEVFGLQYHPVLLRPGETRVVEVEVSEPTTIEARIWRGPVQSWYVAWTEPMTVECEAPATPPATDPTTDPTDAPTTGPSAPPAGGQAGGADELPLTGAPVALLVIGGLAVAATGGGALVLGRRKRAKFQA